MVVRYALVHAGCGNTVRAATVIHGILTANTTPTYANSASASHLSTFT